MIQEPPNSILFQLVIFNEMLDTIVVASGVEALSIGKGGREGIDRVRVSARATTNTINHYPLNNA